MIGVHSAKFPNEQQDENLHWAVRRHQITHPVVNDADFAIWEAYGTRAWPTLVLIDPEGYVVGSISGEGHGEALEEAIRKLIQVFRERGTLVEGPRPFSRPEEASVGVLAFPGKVIADPTGQRVFIADSGHHRILTADLSGKILDIAGDGKPGQADGSFEQASFRNPQGLALHGDFLYVADTENHRVCRLDLKQRTVGAIAGTGNQSLGPPRPGLALNVDLNSPWDLALRDSRLYIAMAGSHQIWILDLSTGSLTLFVGSGREMLQDGTRLQASLNQPSGITLDGEALYIADSEASAIRSVDLGERAWVKTLVGQGLFDFGDRDGSGPGVRLQHPLGIACLDGTLYIVDSYNHKVKTLFPSLGTVSTLWGTGKPGRSAGKEPSFYEPGGICAAAGKLYIADTNNHRICIGDPATGEVLPLPLG